jgi:DNA-binding beta-propeller fold protein YncE
LTPDTGWLLSEGDYGHSGSCDKGHQGRGNSCDGGDHGRHGARYTGASPIAVTIAPDGNTLYVVNDGANSVAAIPLYGKNADQVVGLIPTAYAPKDIAFSQDGSWM